MFLHTVGHHDHEAADCPCVDLSFQDKLCSSSELHLYVALLYSSYNQKQERQSIILYVLQLQIGILASNSNEVNKAALKSVGYQVKLLSFRSSDAKSNATLLCVQILRLNGLTLAALGQAQV